MTNPAPTSFYQNTITSGLQAVYLGPFTTAPTTDNFGNPLVAGQLYFNTTTTQLFIYTQSGWMVAYHGAIANPSGTVGLAAVNGATGLLMDAGSAPALSQAITPTWTGVHIFTASAPQITLGANGGNNGQLNLNGSTSGTVIIAAQATAGSPTLTLPNASGTFAISAAAPLALSATTGNLTVTGAAGQVLAGAGPAFTGTPTLGVNGTAGGTLTLAGATSGSITLSTPAAGGVLSLNGYLATNSGGFQSIAGTGSVTSGLVLLTAAGGGTLTLPAASNKGQEIKIRPTVTTTVAYISASSNVVPLQSSTAGTALLAIGGKFVHLVADGTNWQIVAQG